MPAERDNFLGWGQGWTNMVRYWPRTTSQNGCAGGPCVCSRVGADVQTISIQVPCPPTRHGRKSDSIRGQVPEDLLDGVSMALCAAGCLPESKRRRLMRKQMVGSKWWEVADADADAGACSSSLNVCAAMKWPLRVKRLLTEATVLYCTNMVAGRV